MEPRIEHANLAVENLDGMVRFIRTALPNFGIRAKGKTEDGATWIHIGTDSTYIALCTSIHVPVTKRRPYDGSPGVNHIGFEVSDVEAVRRRLADGGYHDSTVQNNHPFRKRVYFYDPEGNDWEFVQYFSEKPEERNDYRLADE
jgi:catechol 2,3-dioxygenase-like lactoylglutathione lyase family enzyme